MSADEKGTLNSENPRDTQSHALTSNERRTKSASDDSCCLKHTAPVIVTSVKRKVPAQHYGSALRRFSPLSWSLETQISFCHVVHLAPSHLIFSSQRLTKLHERLASFVHFPSILVKLIHSSF